MMMVNAFRRSYTNTFFAVTTDCFHKLEDATTIKVEVKSAT